MFSKNACAALALVTGIAANRRDSITPEPNSGAIICICFLAIAAASTSPLEIAVLRSFTSTPYLSQKEITDALENTSDTLPPPTTTSSAYLLKS